MKKEQSLKKSIHKYKKVLDKTLPEEIEETVIKSL